MTGTSNVGPYPSTESPPIDTSSNTVGVVIGNGDAETDSMALPTPLHL